MCVWNSWHTFWTSAPLGVECSVNLCCGRMASGTVPVSAYWIRSYIDLRASAGVMRRNISASARELKSDYLPCSQALQSHSSLSRITQFCIHIKRKRGVIKSQDNHVICLTVSLQYKNMYTICTSIHNNTGQHTKCIHNQNSWFLFNSTCWNQIWP